MRPPEVWMKNLVMMVGLPRSGKSTEALRLSKEWNAPIVNPDSIHLAVHGTPFRDEANPIVWGIAKMMVRSLFITGYDTVILDACNNTRHRRMEWKAWKGEWNRYYRIVDTDAETCVERALAEGKDYLVDVIKRMKRKSQPVQSEEWDGKVVLHDFVPTTHIGS